MYHTIHGSLMRGRNPVQSFKKVLNFAPASTAAGTQINNIVCIGTDSVAAGQTGPTDAQVPTGSILKYIDVQVSTINLVNIASFFWLTIQHLRSGQGPVDVQAVGGNPQRNQVHKQIQRCIGQSQNTNVVIRFKIPKKFQRVREGDAWEVNYKSDTVYSHATQVIYKFYR